MIKRTFIVAFCVALLVFSIVLPASAANIDYNDLISNIVVDGDNDLVTITVPSEYLLTQIVDGGTGAALVTNVGGTASYSVTSGYPYTVIFYAFQNGTDHLLLDNIPNVTTVSYDFYISNSGGLGYETPTIFSDWYFFDSNSQYLGMSRTEHGNHTLTGEHSFTQIISKVSGTTSGSCNFTFYQLRPLSSGTLSVELRSLKLTFTISSLYRLQQESGKTNKLLSAVEEKLADQGKTLDDILDSQQDTNDKLDGIINGDVDSTPPSGSDVVGDLDYAESGLRDEAQSGLDQGASVQQSAIQVLGQYLSAFACVSWIFDRFSTIPFVSGLLALSFSLGITGAILGIGLSIARSYSVSSRSARSARSKGG